MGNIKISDLPLSERPMEKLVKYGADSLRNEELLAILLRTGTKGENVIDLSTRLILNLGGLDKILGKPKSEEDAYKMLKDLSGKVHRVYSAVVVVNSKTNKVKKECIFTEVKFKDLTNEEILKYISTKEPLDKAGAYGIQGIGGVFVERINGCYYNVVGLPLNLLNNILEEVK